MNPGTPPVVDRRAASRAGGAPIIVNRRQIAAPQGADPFAVRGLVPPTWAMLVPVMIVAFCAMLLASHGLPGVYPAAVWVAAMALVLAAPVLTWLERRVHHGWLVRQGIAILAQGAPLLLFGAVLATWWRQDPQLDATVPLAVMVITGVVTAILLIDRLRALMIAEALLWVGFALILGRWSAWLALAVGLGVMAVAGFQQLALHHARLNQQRARRREQSRAEEILVDFEQTGQSWFWETDRRGQITYISATIAALFDPDPASLVGRAFADLVILDGAQRGNERSLTFHLNARSPFQDLSMRAACPGEERFWSISGRPIYDEFGNFLGFRGSGSDLTEKLLSQEATTRLALFDSLTGLANRLQMTQMLDGILSAPAFAQRACAVMLLDLDRFKQVNDTMGHPAGDALLKQVAQRLLRAVGDKGQVGRLGGDEFQIIVPGQTIRSQLVALSTRIIEQITHPYAIEGSQVVVGVSIGIALSPDDGVTTEALIRNADLALYAAKDRGRGIYHFYDADLHAQAEERRQLEQDLREALRNGGLELVYQPVVQAASERISGFEALLRWNHPTKGALSPAKFIPIAEDAGLIAQIGEWALRTACRDLAHWPAPVRMAVNVSPLQFANASLPAIIANALAQAQVSPDRLELELTESVFLNSSERTDAMFAALKGIGVRLVLDDFGTGYSSLGYLKNAPFDKIKIDQGFVRGATLESSRNAAIIAAIVSLAEALGMETTAEGVELLDELELMRKLGCSHIQGYVYAHAMTFAEACEQLATSLTMEAKGPRSERLPRRSIMRRVVIAHGGQRYDGTIRNISQTGVMIEGLWQVPVGITLHLMLTEQLIVASTVRWSHDGRIGCQFHTTLSSDEFVGLSGARMERVPPAPAPAYTPAPMRKVS